jgi:hypothetical protein
LRASVARFLFGGMKTARSPLVYGIAVLLALTAPAPAAEDPKPENVTLEDIIFDVKYLKQMLGPKTLVTALVETNRDRKLADTALPDTIKAIQAAQLDAKSQLFALPEGATPPKLKTSAPHSYPPGLNISREPKRADFLMLVGADGAVKCLYCYSNNDRLFALAAAAAVVKWRYTPAKINGTAVPVLAGLPMEFHSGDVNVESFKGLPRGQNQREPRDIRLPSSTGPGG